MKQNLITSFHEPVSQVHYLLFALSEFALYYYVIVRTTVFIILGAKNYLALFCFHWLFITMPSD